MVAIMTGIGILWIPVVQNVQGGQLFIYIQAVSAYFSPPIAALYLLSILWTKATEKVWTEWCQAGILLAATNTLLGPYNVMYRRAKIGQFYARVIS